MSKSQLKRLTAQGAIVTAKCIGCGHTKEIRPGEIKPDDVPICEKCYMPMIAHSARKP